MRVAAYITPSMRLKIRGFAAEEGISVSAYLRRLYTERAVALGWKHPEPQTGGYVYLIKCGGAYKIGRTAGNVKTRVFGMSLPMRPEIVATVFSDRYMELEKELHARFACKRGYGEWFELEEKDIQEIQRLFT